MRNDKLAAEPQLTREEVTRRRNTQGLTTKREGSSSAVDKKGLRDGKLHGIAFGGDTDFTDYTVLIITSV